MFDLDISKMVLVAVVALVVVGPKELPHVLRAFGKAISRMRSLQFSVQKAAIDFMAEADLEGIGKELGTFEKGMWTSIATNPATAMRGTLPAFHGESTGASVSKIEALHYSSPEMEAYLSPPSQSLPNNDPRICESGGASIQVEDVVLSGSGPDPSQRDATVQGDRLWLRRFRPRTRAHNKLWRGHRVVTPSPARPSTLSQSR